MDSLLFIATFLCLGVVIAWFVRNDKEGADGQLGLLAVKPDGETNSETDNFDSPRYAKATRTTTRQQNPDQLENIRRTAAENAAAANKPQAFRQKQGRSFTKTAQNRHRTKQRITPKKTTTE